MNKIYGIDPGPEESALVVVNYSGEVLEHHYGINSDIETLLRVAQEKEDSSLAIEFIQSYGMAVGKATFFTCKAVGRFEASWGDKHESVLYSRPHIKGHLVGGVKGVKDKHIRRALIQRFGESKKGHPLYGITKHKWAALAVAITHMDCLKMGSTEFYMTYP